MDKIEILWAIEQIKQLRARYFRTTDLRLTDEFLDVFSDDLVWIWYAADNETVLKEINGPGEFRAWLESIGPNRFAGFSCHMGHTPEIEIVDENFARGIWPIEDYVHNPGDKHFKGYGHYYDEYKRNANGEWKISRSELKRIHVDVLGVEGEQVAR